MSTTSLIHLATESPSSGTKIVCSIYKSWDGYPENYGNAWWIYHHCEEMKAKIKAQRIPSVQDRKYDVPAEFVHYLEAHGQNSISLEPTAKLNRLCGEHKDEISYVYLVTMPEDLNFNVKIWNRTLTKRGPGRLIFDDLSSLLPEKFPIPKYTPAEFGSLRDDRFDLTRDICEKIMREHPINAGLVPPRFADYDLCRLIIDQAQEHSENFRTYIYESILPTYLEFDELGNKEKRLIAKPKLNVEQIALLNTLQHKTENVALSDIPDHLQTQDFFRELVRLNPRYFGQLPDEAKTLSICATAVAHDGLHLKNVPEYYRSLEWLCQMAMKKNPHACEFFGPELDKNFARETYREALSRSAYDLTVVPKDKLDVDLCLQAVSANPLAFIQVPENLKTWEVCEAGYYNRMYRGVRLEKEEEDLLAKALPTWLKDKNGQPLDIDAAKAQAQKCDQIESKPKPKPKAKKASKNNEAATETNAQSNNQSSGQSNGQSSGQPNDQSNGQSNGQSNRQSERKVAEAKKSKASKTRKKKQESDDNSDSDLISPKP